MSDHKIDLVLKKMDQQFKTKKIINIFLCFLIFILGITSFIYKAVYEGGVLTCFREMTVNGSVFTAVVSFAFMIMNIVEVKRNVEITSKPLYYLRLSSAVTEAIILVVVLIGLLPFFPDHPTFLRYDMMNMHVLLPVLTMVSFVTNDPPIGKLSRGKRALGMIHVILYAIIIIFLIAIEVIPSDKIPYAFLDVLNGNPMYTIAAAIGIGIFGYLFSWLFSVLNRKIYWLSYRNLSK